jgi:acyl carrier protein
MAAVRARELLRQVGVEADLCDQLADDDDLLGAGIGSAELIELGLRVEDALGKELTAEEVERLATLRDIDACLAAGAAR